MKSIQSHLLIIFCAVAMAFPAIGLSAEAMKASGPTEKKIVSTEDHATFDDQFQSTKKLAKEKNWIEAQKQARALIASAPSDAARLELARFLREVRFQLLFSKKQTDTSERYEVKSDDTLGKIAKKYNTTIELIRKTNKIKKNVVWAGMKLKVEKVHFSIEISIPKNVLWLKQGEHYVKKYRVSTGEKGNTPTGNVKIANKVINPSWY